MSRYGIVPKTISASCLLLLVLLAPAVNTPAADYVAAPGMRVGVRGRAGYLYFPDERVRLEVSVLPAPDQAEVTLDGTVQSVPALPGADAIPPAQAVLTRFNGYKSLTELKLPGLGYYEIQWTVSCGGGEALPGRTAVAVIPRNPQDKRRPNSPFGVNVHSWWQGPYMQVVRRLGIAWIRDHMGGKYDQATGQYQEIDPNIIEAEANKLCYLPISEYFERGSTELKEVNGTWVLPSAARQVEAYARKNRARITHFELYNEPHGFGWGGRFDPGGPLWSGGKWVKPFVDFGIAQTRALHRGDPGMKMIWPEIDVFLHTKLFADAGAKPYIQAIAPHTYSIHSEYPEHQAFVTSMPEIMTYLREHEMPIDIWATEVGWASFSDNIARPDGYVGYRPQTETRQAEKLARLMILHRVRGIARTFWYDFYEDGDNPSNAEERFGIVRYNPVYPANPGQKVPDQLAISHDTLEPKPAAVAYANIIHWLEQAEWLGKYPSGGWIYAFKRRGSGETVLVAWCEKAEKSEVRMVRSGVREVSLTDIYGRSRRVQVKDGAFSITLTESPVFITGLKSADVIPLLSPLIR